MWEVVIPSVVTAVFGGGTVGVVLTKWMDRNKTEAETGQIDASAAETIASAAATLLVPLQAQVLNLSEQVNEVSKQAKEAKDRVAVVEDDNKAIKHLFGLSVAHIEDLNIYIDVKVPDPVDRPVTPVELRKEVP